jgi:hypothetical protein
MQRVSTIRCSSSRLRITSGTVTPLRTCSSATRSLIVRSSRTASLNTVASLVRKTSPETPSEARTRKALSWASLSPSAGFCATRSPLSGS